METKELILRQIETIELSDVYYTLKMMKVRFLSEDQQRVVRIILAFRQLGILAVPSTLVASLYGTTQANVVSILHKLGDKGVLVLVKNNGAGALRYMLSERFISIWEVNHGQSNLPNAKTNHPF